MISRSLACLGVNQYPARCSSCSSPVPALAGRLYRLGSARRASWRVRCLTCEAAPARPSSTTTDNRQDTAA